MQAFQKAAVMFCLSCICAEMVTLLTGSGWARRCIKALAGLYILVVLLRVFPTAGTELQKMTVPAQDPVELPSADVQILEQAESRLERSLEAECLEQFGVKIELQVTLEQNDKTVRAVRAVMTVPGGSTDLPRCRDAAEYLRQRLDTEVEIRTGEDAD